MQHISNLVVDAPMVRCLGKREETFSLMSLVVAGPKVAVLREEGSNGDREMAASLFMAGFEVWDVTTQDVMDCSISMDHFRGVVFPGGFSYAGDIYMDIFTTNALRLQISYIVCAR